MAGLQSQMMRWRWVEVLWVSVLGVVVCAVVALAANSARGRNDGEPIIAADTPAGQAESQHSEISDSSGGDIIEISYCGSYSDKPMPCVFIGTDSVSKDQLTEPGGHLVYQCVVSASTFDSLVAIVSAFELGETDQVIDSSCCYNFVVERDSSEAVHWVLDCTETHRLTGLMLDTARRVDGVNQVVEALDNLWKRTTPWQ